jgi:hypothetical protein
MAVVSLLVWYVFDDDVVDVGLVWFETDGNSESLRRKEKKSGNLGLQCKVKLVRLSSTNKKWKRANTFSHLKLRFQTIVDVMTNRKDRKSLMMRTRAMVTRTTTPRIHTKPMYNWTLILWWFHGIGAGVVSVHRRILRLLFRWFLLFRWHFREIDSNDFLNWTQPKWSMKENDKTSHNESLALKWTAKECIKV